MKKYLFILLVLFLFGLTGHAEALSQPRLFVNDSLKECQMYSENATEKVIDGWRNARFGYPKILNPISIDGNNSVNQVQAEKTYSNEGEYCSSLGYTMHQDRKIAEVKGIKYINAIKIIFWFIFICLVSFYYFNFINKKKRYIVFSLYLLATAFILGVIVYPFVIYQINPCYPTSFLMGCF